MTKSKNPMIRIHDIELDEVIDREMTDDEFVIYKANQVEALARQNEAKAEAEAKETSKQAILDRIGLTADELKTILG